MNNFFKILLVFTLISQCVPKCIGQMNYFEAGGALGIANYSGDMSSDKVGQVLGTSKFSAQGFVRYNMTPYLNFKMGLTYARLAADDANADSQGRRDRGLSFFTDLYETALTAEINVFKYEPLEGSSIFSLYAMGGIAGFYFNPLTEYEGQIYRLQQLGTEGQGLPEYPDRDFYSLYQMALPFGGGMKFKINEALNFNMEMSWRLTFTDYLDDVSTTYPIYNALRDARGEIAADLSHRSSIENKGELNDRVRGNPDVRDYYFTLHVGVSYNLVDFGSYNGYRRSNRKSRTSKCPKF